MASQTANQQLSVLQDKATQLRIDSIRATTEAGSGHPTSSTSAAEIVSTLFFSVMRFDPKDPANRSNDVFILSKGHAAPVLYSAWAEAGAFPREDLLRLRKLNSDLEGHPTPRLPFVPVATGSLGQGLSAGVGMALAVKYLGGSGQRIYVLLGDAESAEGAVWEAAHMASYYKLDNLCATIDINRLGQSGPTVEEHDIEAYRARWTAFGWNALPVDGHSIPELLAVYENAERVKDRPTVVLARTIKGKGIPPVEDKNGYHGKPLDRKEAEEVIRQLEQQRNGNGAAWKPKLPLRAGAGRQETTAPAGALPAAPYAPGAPDVATRQAFGAALAALGGVNRDVVALDGDVKNSTYTEEFEKAHPDRFFEMYIAEQNMVGAATGLAARGKIPFVATFACFLTRAYDFIRMAAISGSNIKLVGTHAGVSIGEDGPSQMGLEDLAMICAEPDFTALEPSDAVSAWYATGLAADVRGPVYVRTARPKSPILYRPDEKFEIGRCKVLRRSDNDQATVVAAGVTVAEALAAYEQLAREGIAIRIIDLFSVQPIDRQAIIESARATGGRVITVEDHYLHGGIGDAVLSALAGERATVHKLAVAQIPRSGSQKELMDLYGISARHIVEQVKSITGR